MRPSPRNKTFFLLALNILQLVSLWQSYERLNLLRRGQNAKYCYISKHVHTLDCIGRTAGQPQQRQARLVGTARDPPQSNGFLMLFLQPMEMGVNPKHHNARRDRLMNDWVSDTATGKFSPLRLIGSIQVITACCVINVNFQSQQNEHSGHDASRVSKYPPAFSSLAGIHIALRHVPTEHKGVESDSVGIILNAEVGIVPIQLERQIL